LDSSLALLLLFANCGRDIITQNTNRTPQDKQQSEPYQSNSKAFSTTHQNYLEKVMHLLLYNSGTDYLKTRTSFTETKAQRGIKTQ
jgi:hypothetical protein